MRKQNREPEPDILAMGKSEWTARWIRRHEENKPFRWPEVEKRGLNAHLLESLGRQTVGHCSFCDGFPVRGTSNETIEHFRPKSAFPALAFDWANLFYSCDACQTRKRDAFAELLLKPDEPDYRFDLFFRCNYSTGKLEPNPQASAEDQARATATIEIYGLNEDGRPTNRLRELRKFDPSTGFPLDEYAYRDFLCP